MTGSGADIEHLSFRGRRPFNRANKAFSPCELLRRCDNDIHWKWDSVQGLAYVQALFKNRSLHRHYHQQIHVAARMSVASCLRTEQNDLLRIELLHDPFHHTVDV